MKILLVQDNQIDRNLVEKSLREVAQFDHELTTCRSLGAALSRLAESTFDVVLLDLWLPDCQGAETCRRLIEQSPSTPVVVMTSEDDRSSAAQAIRYGARHSLVKGTDPGAAIASLLQIAIDRHRNERDVARRESRLCQMLGHVPALIWTTGPDLSITGVAGRISDSLPLVPEHIIGLALDERLFHGMGHGSAGTDVSALIRAQRLAIEGQSGSVEFEWRGRTFEARINPLYDADRNVEGTIGVALDVTDRSSLVREIEFAQMVQERLMPASRARLAGFDIFGGTHAARQTSGDWFDYLHFDDDSMGLVVGDVSGKGFGPAILSATVAAFLEAIAEDNSDVRMILNRVNRLVCSRRLTSQFAVLSLARLDPVERRVDYGGAGERMMIVDRDGDVKHHVAASGLPLGLIPDTGYDTVEGIPLDPGDVLLLLTDGFREAHKADGVLFGDARVHEVVAAHRNASAADILSALWSAVVDFTGTERQQDDMTGIVARVVDRPPASSSDQGRP